MSSPTGKEERGKKELIGVSQKNKRKDLLKKKRKRDQSQTNKEYKEVRAQQRRKERERGLEVETQKVYEKRLKELKEYKTRLNQFYRNNPRIINYVGFYYKLDEFFETMDEEERRIKRHRFPYEEKTFYVRSIKYYDNDFYLVSLSETGNEFFIRFWTAEDYRIAGAQTDLLMDSEFTKALNRLRTLFRKDFNDQFKRHLEGVVIPKSEKSIEKLITFNIISDAFLGLNLEETHNAFKLLEEVKSTLQKFEHPFRIQEELSLYTDTIAFPMIQFITSGTEHQTNLVFHREIWMTYVFMKNTEDFFDDVFDYSDFLTSKLFAQYRGLRPNDPKTKSKLWVSKHGFESRARMNYRMFNTKYKVMESGETDDYVFIEPRKGVDGYFFVEEPKTWPNTVFVDADTYFNHKYYQETCFLARDIFKKMCQSIQGLHDFDIVHSDVKWENYLIMMKKSTELFGGYEIVCQLIDFWTIKPHGSIGPSGLTFIPPEYFLKMGQNERIFMDQFDQRILRLKGPGELQNQRLIRPSAMIPGLTSSQYSEDRQVGSGMVIDPEGERISKEERGKIEDNIVKNLEFITSPSDPFFGHQQFPLDTAVAYIKDNIAYVDFNLLIDFLLDGNQQNKTIIELVERCYFTKSAKISIVELATIFGNNKNVKVLREILLKKLSVETNTGDIRTAKMTYVTSSLSNYPVMKASDIYSLGVILYQIFCSPSIGDFFNYKNTYEYRSKNWLNKDMLFTTLKIELNFRENKRLLENLPFFETMFNLMGWMLNVDVSKRPSIEQVLGHKFFREDTIVVGEERKVDLGDPKYFVEYLGEIFKVTGMTEASKHEEVTEYSNWFNYVSVYSEKFMKRNVVRKSIRGESSFPSFNVETGDYGINKVFFLSGYNELMSNLTGTKDILEPPLLCLVQLDIVLAMTRKSIVAFSDGMVSFNYTYKPLHDETPGQYIVITNVGIGQNLFKLPTPRTISRTEKITAFRAIIELFEKFLNEFFNNAIQGVVIIMRPSRNGYIYPGKLKHKHVWPEHGENVIELRQTGGGGTEQDGAELDVDMTEDEQPNQPIFNQFQPPQEEEEEGEEEGMGGGIPAPFGEESEFRQAFGGGGGEQQQQPGPHQMIVPHQFAVPRSIPRRRGGEPPETMKSRDDCRVNDEEKEEDGEKTLYMF